MQQILDAVKTFDHVLVLSPEHGSTFPEISWGDHYFYFSPDGEIPQRTQPFATVVTKDYPDDAASRLGVDGRWRVNIHVGRDRAVTLTGTGPWDHTITDVIVPHPLYGMAGWVSVVNPAELTSASVLDLLRGAYDDQRRRLERQR